MTTSVRAGNGIPKPFSAYRVGLLSHTIPMRVTLFRNKPENEWKTAQGVYHAIADLTESMLHLSKEIPQNELKKINAYLTDLSERWMAVRTMVGEYQHTEKKWNHEIVANVQREPFPGTWTCIYRLGYQLGTLKAFFDLGTAVGIYWAQLDEIDVDAPLPDLSGIVTAAQTIAKDLPAAMPSVLGAVIEFSAKSPDLHPRTVLTQALQTVAVDVQTDVFGPKFDGYVMTLLIHAFDQSIQESLLELSVTETSREAALESRKGTKPLWDKDRFELRVGDQVVRKVRPLAKNIIKVLDSFQEEGWPETIYDPLSGDIWSIRHDTIRSLNEGLSLIRFRADGTKERIKWEWL